MAVATKCDVCGDVPVDGEFLCLRHKEYYRQTAERESRKADLYWALRTRVLTVEEMDEVREQDYGLLVRNGQCFKTAEVQKIFNDALLQQFMIRLAVEKAGKP